MHNAKVIAVCNHKGGVGKTVTTASLGVSLADEGKKVLLVDLDFQGNLTKGFGYRDRKLYNQSVRELLLNEINETPQPTDTYVISTEEGVDLIPANLALADLDIHLSAVMSRETVLKRALEPFQKHYDYILIDTHPALNLFTINTFVAANSLLIPMQAEPYATDGLEDLLRTAQRTKKQLNPTLGIEGIVLTMTDARTVLSKHISQQIREDFGDRIKVFNAEIPRCVRTAEAPLANQSVMAYAPTSETAKAYKALTKEVLKQDGKRITKAPTQLVR